MVAHDLVGRIALGSLSATIPVGDDPIGIEHVDGIVGDVLDQELVSVRRGRT